MPSTAIPPSEDARRRQLAERLREAAATLEELAADRGLLALVSEDDRIRLRQAVADVYNPDARARRAMVKAIIRERKSAIARRDDRVRGETGIRALRRQPVFTTPERLPAVRRRAANHAGAAALLHLQAGLHRRPSLLRPAVPGVWRPELREADGTGRPAGTRGAADRRTRQDRLPGGAEAAAGGRAPDRHDAIPARLRRALRRRSRLRGVARSAGDLRPRSAAHAQRRGVLRAPGRDAQPAGLHHQQRVPDRAPAARVLRAHDGDARPRRSSTCPSTRARCSEPTRPR